MRTDMVHTREKTAFRFVLVHTLTPGPGAAINAVI